MYDISPYVHFPYEQKFLFVRKLSQPVHELIFLPKGRKKLRKTFDYNEMRLKVVNIILI